MYGSLGESLGYRERVWVCSHALKSILSNVCFVRDECKIIRGHTHLERPPPGSDPGYDCFAFHHCYEVQGFFVYYVSSWHMEFTGLSKHKQQRFIGHTNQWDTLKKIL
jgi:hypothetical protein